MRKVLIAVATSCILVASQPANAVVNLVTNGDFEGGTTAPLADGSVQPAGWTYTVIPPVNSNATVIAYGQNGGYPTGAFTEAVPAITTSTSTILVGPGGIANPFASAVNTKGLYLSSDTGAYNLSQNLSVAVLGTYTFGFDFYLPQNGVNNPNGATFTAVIGDQTIVFNASAYAAQQWYTYTGTASVSAASDTFQLAFRANGVTAKDFVIDNVFLTQAGAVPEPLTWAMMVGGFGLMGASMRRRRISTTFA